MRLIALLVTTILTAAPVMAQQAQPSSAAPQPSSAKDAPPALPVSLDRIRGALEQTPADPLKGLDGREGIPQFRLEIREKQRIDELLATLDFKSPAVPGGLYGYDQQQRLWSKTNHPLAQPYAAFSPGELIQVSITTLLAKYFAARLMKSISESYTSHLEQAARDEVMRELAAFCAAQPYGGKGVQGCDPIARAIR